MVTNTSSLEQKACQFSDNLRRTFMKINPHHISCQYKLIFEENAKGKLREIDCMGVLGGPAGGFLERDAHARLEGSKVAVTTTRSADHIYNHSESNHDEGCVQRPSLSPHGCLLLKKEQDLEGCQGKAGSQGVTVEAWSDRDYTCNRDALRDPTDGGSSSQPAYLTDIFFGRIFQEISIGNDKREACLRFQLSPWSTCKFCHVEDLDHQLLDPAFVMSKGPSPWTRPRSMPPTRSNGPHNSDSSDNINTISKYLNWKPADATKTTQSKKRSVGHVTEPLPPPPKESQSWLQREKSTMSQRPRQRSAVQYHFEHSKSHRFYMKQYRDQYTDRLQCRRLTGSGLDDFRGEPSTIPKVHVHCDDVREGAVLRVSQFRFKVNKPIKFRTAGHTIMWRKGREGPQSAFSRPQPVTPAGACKSPVIFRSRPSIPSNARGIVCASAVETPTHTVVYSVPGPSSARVYPTDS